MRQPHKRDPSKSITTHASRGVREEMAKVTLARKIVAISLRLWKTGEVWDATKLNVQAT